MAKELPEMRVVLLGKTGSGKSSIGNTLMGREAFRVARGLLSGTERCHWADEEREGFNLQVTDTPGLCDTHRDDDEVLKEVGKSVAVARPGPHVVLMVLRCDSRFTEEEYGAFLALKQLFGEDIKNYMILVFVGADAYGRTLEEQQRGVYQEMSSASGHVQKVLKEANNRFFGINNKAVQGEREMQAKKLIEMIKDLIKTNGGKYFTNSVSDEVGELVKPLVERRIKNDNSSREQADRETNLAIVAETEDPEFFDRLMGFMKKKVIPALDKAARLLHVVVAVATKVAPLVKASRSCSLM